MFTVEYLDSAALLVSLLLMGSFLTDFLLLICYS